MIFGKAEKRAGSDVGDGDGGAGVRGAGDAVAILPHIPPVSQPVLVHLSKNQLLFKSLSQLMPFCARSDDQTQAPPMAAVPHTALIPALSSAETVFNYVVSQQI